MSLALLKLIALNATAMLRRALRGVRTGRGATFVAIGAVMVSAWLATGFFRASSAGRNDPETVRTFFPLWLLAICVLNLLTSAGERAIAFTPAEVDVLFSGPFTRRQLMSYKLLKSVAGAVVTATLFSLMFLSYMQSWAAGWVGIFLSLLFLQLFTMSVVLIGETLHERASIRGRKLIAAALIVTIAGALLPVLRAGQGRSLSDLAMAFASTGAGRVLLAPVAVFGDILAAKQLAPDALPSLAVAALVLGVLATMVIWLDAQYLELAARTGRKAHERIERLQRGGVIGFRPQPGARARCLRIPLPPRLNGVGPIAWRQLTTAVRQSRGVIMVLLLLCAALGPALYLAGAAEHPAPLALIIGIVCSMNALFANALRFDFRGDLGYLDVLKSLPLRPATIVVAQLVAPTLVLTICQIPLFAGLGFFFSVDAYFVLAAALTAIPLNALVFAIENVLFLQFPARNWGVSPGDLHGVGRRMTISFAKTVILLVACGVAVNAGRLASIATEKSPAVFIVTTAVVLALETLALLPLMVTTFRRFDPSSERPF